MRVPDEELMLRLGTDPAALGEFSDRHVDRILTFAARRFAEPEAAADVPLAFDPATGQNVGLQVSPRLSLPERFPRTPEMAARWR